jgi:hypothetical protein
MMVEEWLVSIYNFKFLLGKLGTLKCTQQIKTRDEGKPYKNMVGRWRTTVVN